MLFENIGKVSRQKNLNIPIFWTFLQYKMIYFIKCKIYFSCDAIKHMRAYGEKRDIPS